MESTPRGLMPKRQNQFSLTDFGFLVCGNFSKNDNTKKKTIHHFTGASHSKWLIKIMVIAKKL
jgi:hypothetical protein